MIDRLSQLRYELTTDKQFVPLKDNGDDVQVWNQALEELRGEIGAANLSWFKAPWLFAECYMYRRIREALLACKSDMKHYDPFEQAKIDTCEQSKKSTSKLIAAICPIGFDKDEKENPEVLRKRFYTIAQVIFKKSREICIFSNKNLTFKAKISVNSDQKRLSNDFSLRTYFRLLENIYIYLKL